MADTEASVQSAISGYESGIYSSSRRAATAYGVPEATVRARIRGAASRRVAHQHQQRLSPDQVSHRLDT
ncbi:hypothetical protein PSPO01_16035 [Paraphaeosphaeria sporulosa]